MNDKKMIIRNCPAILKMSKVCDDYRTTRDNPELCQDCTDCVMKQIVKLCKDTCQDCFNVKRTTYTQCKDLNNCKTAKILKLLNIQEVE